MSDTCTIIHEFMAHSHHLLHVHAQLLTCCIMHAMRVYWCLLGLLHGALLVCLLHVRGLMLMSLRLHVSGCEARACTEFSGSVKAGSHQEEEYQRWGFPSGRRFTSCLRGGGRSKFSAGRLCTGAGCRFTCPAGNQAQVLGGLLVPLPTRRFLSPNSCHLDAEWVTGNRWAGTGCAVPLSRGSGC